MLCYVRFRWWVSRMSHSDLTTRTTHKTESWPQVLNALKRVTTFGFSNKFYCAPTFLFGIFRLLKIFHFYIGVTFESSNETLCTCCSPHRTVPTWTLMSTLHEVIWVHYRRCNTTCSPYGVCECSSPTNPEYFRPASSPNSQLTRSRIVAKKRISTSNNNAVDVTWESRHKYCILQAALSILYRPHSKP